MISSPFHMLLLLVLQAVAVVGDRPEENLVRKRRNWIPPPKLLNENEDYTQRDSVARIHSDYDDGRGNLVYSLKGFGADRYPFHVFVVNGSTGHIRVTKVLDRELIGLYNLAGTATFSNGSLAEQHIDIRFKVVDKNDNPPIFEVFKPLEVDELSPTGTMVGKINATDADEPGNINSKIAYTIINQNPPDGMFIMNTDGTIYVKKPVLDRETKDHYILTVKGQDLNGQPGGHSGTGMVTIKVRDVNDNLPTLEKEEYEGSIVEEEAGVEVMRIKAEDLDLEGTENWEVVFEILKGNKAGFFSITTDPDTNEGILMLDKPVDYEDVKNLELGLIVKNKASPHGSVVYPGAEEEGGAGGEGGAGAGAGGGTSGAAGVGAGYGGSSGSSGMAFKTYPIKIKVQNKPEGPRFDPKVKAIPVTEGGNDTEINAVVAQYPAIDGDTLERADNVRYVKGSDPDNWLTIDPITAEIRLNKIPDRESSVVVNGTYFAEVLCISEDFPGQTATGTIAVQVEDFNDHCPILTSDVKTLCSTESAVIVDACDEDADPNGPPFDFAIVEENTEGKWQVEHLNETAAILRAQEFMWPGFYKVELVVKDQQGESCPEPQEVTIQVCTCVDGVMCGRQGANKEVELGPAAIGLLLMGLLLLCFIPLLLLSCRCGSAAGFPDLFTEMPFDTKSHLINYRTEHQGENTEVPLLNMSTHIDGDALLMGTAQKVSTASPAGLKYQRLVTSEGAYEEGCSSLYKEGLWKMNQQNVSGFHLETGGSQIEGDGEMYDDMALPENLLQQYYDQVTSRNDNVGVKDGLLVHDFEGDGSPAGSVGCCSLLEPDNDLQFLNDLGPKFKTLAAVCGGMKIPDESNPVPTGLPSAPAFAGPQEVKPPPQVVPNIPKGDQIVVSEAISHSPFVKTNMMEAAPHPPFVKTNTVGRNVMTTLKTERVNQNQMFLLPQQQPVYYTTSSVLQPVHYVVQPQVQNTVLLAETPSTNLAGMVLVKDTQSVSTPDLLIQGQTIMSNGQAQGPSMVKREKGGLQGADIIHTRNFSGPCTMMVIESKVPLGSMKGLRGSQTCLVPGGTPQSGGLSGSKRVVMVGDTTSSERQLIQESGGLFHRSDASGSQRVLNSKGSASTKVQSRNIGPFNTIVKAAPCNNTVVVQD